MFQKFRDKLNTLLLFMFMKFPSIFYYIQLNLLQMVSMTLNGPFHLEMTIELPKKSEITVKQPSPLFLPSPVLKVNVFTWCEIIVKYKNPIVIACVYRENERSEYFFTKHENSPIFSVRLNLLQWWSHYKFFPIVLQYLWRVVTLFLCIFFFWDIYLEHW